MNIAQKYVVLKYFGTLTTAVQLRVLVIKLVFKTACNKAIVINEFYVFFINDKNRYRDKLKLLLY